MAIYHPGRPTISTSTGSISGDFVTIDTNQTISGKKTFTGDIRFDGTVLNDLVIEDNTIILNSGEIGTGVSEGSAGFEVDRGLATNSKILFNENLAGDSDNRWVLDIGDGSEEQIVYDNIPDDVTFNGKLTVNNDLNINFDLTLNNLSGNNDQLLVLDNNGKVTTNSLSISASTLVTTENITSSDIPYTPYDETYYDFVNPAVATNFNDVKSALDGNSYQSAVSFQTSRNLSSTGVIDGGELGVFDSTSVYVSAGRGVIVDHETLSGPFGSAASATLVTWDSFTTEVPNITGSEYSLLSLDSNGDPYWKMTPFSPEEHRDYIILGKVIHRNGTNDFTSNLQHRNVDVYSQFIDLGEAVGPLNLTGNIISEHDPNNTLEIAKSAGTTFRLNYDSVNNIKNPHQSTEVLQDPATFFRVYRDGSGDWTYVSGQTLIDPDNYDDGSGTLASVSNNKFTVQRIYMFPGSGRLYVFYGQTEYANIDIAKEAALNDVWDGPPGNFFDATLRSYLIVQEGITDFSNDTRYFILNAGKFQGGSGTGGSAAIINTFSDSNFAVYYDAQPDKALSFDLSNLDVAGEEIILSANASQNGDITVTFPSETGQLALTSEVDSVAAGVAAISSGSLDDRYVNVTGDTMTGQLEIDTDAETALLIHSTDSLNPSIAINAESPDDNFIEGRCSLGNRVFEVGVGSISGAEMALYGNCGSGLRWAVTEDQVLSNVNYQINGEGGSSEAALKVQKAFPIDHPIVDFEGDKGEVLQLRNKDFDHYLSWNGDNDFILGKDSNEFRFAKGNSWDGTLIWKLDSDNDEFIFGSNYPVKVQNDFYITSLTPALSGNFLTWDADGKLVDSGINKSEVISLSGDVEHLEQIIDDTDEPIGFVNRTDSTLSYNEGTRNLTLTGNYKVYTKGGVTNDFTGESLTVDNTDGIHFLYYDHNSNFTEQLNIPWDFENDSQVAIVWIDSVNNKGILFEERHGIVMDWATHRRLHLVQGTQVEADDFQIGGSTLQPSSPTNSDNQVTFAAGNIHDEDILVSQGSYAAGNYTVVYRSGSGNDYRISDGNTVPLLAGTYAQWNEFTGATWQLTEIGNGDYINYFVFITTAVEEKYQKIFVPGQHVHDSLGEAENEGLSNMDFGTLFPLVEIAPLYKITFRSSASYGTTGKVRIEEITRLGGSRSEITGGTPASIHNSLSGLQGGTFDEYYHLTSAEYSDYIGATEVTNVSGNLQTQIDNISGSGTGTTDELGTGTQTITSNESIVPSVSGAYDLGTPETPWRSGYFTNNSIHIGNDTISSDSGILKLNNTKIPSLDNINTLYADMAIMLANSGNPYSQMSVGGFTDSFDDDSGIDTFSNLQVLSGSITMAEPESESIYNGFELTLAQSFTSSDTVGLVNFNDNNDIVVTKIDFSPTSDQGDTMLVDLAIVDSSWEVIENLNGLTASKYQQSPLRYRLSSLSAEIPSGGGLAFKGQSTGPQTTGTVAPGLTSAYGNYSSLPTVGNTYGSIKPYSQGFYGQIYAYEVTPSLNQIIAESITITPIDSDSISSVNVTVVLNTSTLGGENSKVQFSTDGGTIWDDLTLDSSQVSSNMWAFKCQNHPVTPGNTAKLRYISEDELSPTFKIFGWSVLWA